MSALRGRRILVTRTRDQATGLVDLLHERGAEAMVVPLITTRPLLPPAEIAAAAAALRGVAAPRWVAFTSATAVRLVLGVCGRDGLAGVNVAAVGRETAAALAERGVAADVVARDQDAAGLAAILGERSLAGGTVWFPGAEAAGAALPDGLRAAGAAVRVHAVYRTEMPADAPRRLRAALDEGVDAVTLTSGSTVRHLVTSLGGRRLPPGLVVVCIGPRTAAEAREAGLEVHGVAAEPGAHGLVAALEAAFGGDAGGGRRGAGRLVG